MKVFIDSNIPMYVAGRDHPFREPARRFLERARDGAIEACTSTEVLQEILYRYYALQRADFAHQVYDLFVQLCPTVFAVTLADTDRAKEILSRKLGTAVRDAMHAAVMLNNDIRHIASFDHGFDPIEEIERLAPT